MQYERGYPPPCIKIFFCKLSENNKTKRYWASISMRTLTSAHTTAIHQHRPSPDVQSQLVDVCERRLNLLGAFFCVHTTASRFSLSCRSRTSNCSALSGRRRPIAGFGAATTAAAEVGAPLAAAVVAMSGVARNSPLLHRTRRRCDSCPVRSKADEHREDASFVLQLAPTDPEPDVAMDETDHVKPSTNTSGKMSENMMPAVSPLLPLGWDVSELILVLRGTQRAA